MQVETEKWYGIKKFSFYRGQMRMQIIGTPRRDWGGGPFPFYLFKIDLRASL
jgi:hypothetical protein